MDDAGSIMQLEPKTPQARRLNPSLFNCLLLA